MTRFAYYASPDGFRSMRGDLLTSVTGLPAWGRLIVTVLAIPGIILIALSLLALAASIAALLLLTVPAYSLLRKIAGPRGTRSPSNQDMTGPSPVPPYRNGPSRPVQATVID